MQVGIYARISADLEGMSLGVARQEADCRKLAKLRRWTVARAYVDNDVSAFNTKVTRPEFERLLADLSSGVIDGVVVYDLDRFARQPTDLERAIGIFDSRPLVFATVQGDIDLGTADGRIGVDAASALKAEARRRVADDEFFGFIGYASIVTRRPYGKAGEQAE